MPRPSFRPPNVSHWNLLWLAPLSLIVSYGLFIEPVLSQRSAVPDSLVERIKAEEGFRSHPYVDTLNNITFGYGFTYVTEQEAHKMLIDRISASYSALERDISGWTHFEETTKLALVDLAYQIGPHGVSEFRDMLGALTVGDCAKAKAAALDSAWAKETPNRARRVVSRLCSE